MTAGVYFPTASNVMVYLNGYQVDMAYRIDYRESSPKIPIYGYNDSEYNKVAQGRNIIQGFLIINFVFPNYLGLAIKAAGNTFMKDTKTIGSPERKIANELKTELPINLSEEDKIRRAEYIASLIENDSLVADTVDRLNKMFYTSNNPVKKTENVLLSPLNQDKKLKGSTLDMYFDDPVSSSWLLRFKNVYFTEISQQASQAGAEGSSEPLYEVYSFIASERNVILL